MKRGDLVPVILPGAYGKPRPALIVQSDLFDEHPSVTLLPVTSDLRETPLFRITIEPTESNGLRQISQVIVDKLHTVPRDKIGSAFGRLADSDLVAINRALALFLGFS